MKLKVDNRTCLRSGLCTYLHPALFREDERGYPEVLVEEPAGEQLAEAEEAIEVCPSQAITLEED